MKEENKNWYYEKGPGSVEEVLSNAFIGAIVILLLCLILGKISGAQYAFYFLVLSGIITLLTWLVRR